MIGQSCGVSNCRQDIVPFQKRIISQYFLLACSMAQKIEDIRNPHPLAANAWLPATFARFNGDPFQ